MKIEGFSMSLSAMESVKIQAQRASPKWHHLDLSVNQEVKWVTENVPKISLLGIARQGVEAEADRLIALHYIK
jgi:hypothetical protein